MSNDRIISHFDVTASALTAERARMRVIASNIANIHTTRTADGGPYKRQFAVLLSKEVENSPIERGVIVNRVVTDNSPPKLVYDPEHPDADKDGYVAYPNIDLVREVTDMKSATLAYQANVSVLSATKQMISQALKISD